METSERAIFEAAAEIEDPKSRGAYLDHACGTDHQLRSSVESLLKSNDDAGSFLDVPAVEQMGHDCAADNAHTVIGNIGNDDSDEEAPLDLSFLQPATKDGSIGTLGHYEIIEVLGQGGFGIVFKAFDEQLHRHVAIKTMNVQMAASSPPRKRFLREARAAAAIRDNNVVQVYSVGEQPLPYLVMEFIDGRSLQEKQSDQGPLDVAELLHLGRQISSGLAAAHSQSLIHRDVKPANILLEHGTDQKIKITDFGLARTADDASLTRSGMISGTPLYMAPEQAMGQTLDHRSDLFSLGSVLYELTTGRPPFRAPSTVAVLKRVVDDTQRPIRDIIPETPLWLVTIIERLLQKDPDDRYQSAKEVVDLLTQCQSELQRTGNVTCVPADSQPLKGTATLNHTDSKTPDVVSTAPAGSKITLSKAIYIGMIALVGVLAFLATPPIINSFTNPPIPTLPETNISAGLLFDGKRDYVQIPVNWSDPQFTIEAFVTTDKDNRGGTVFELSNEEKGDKEEAFRLFQGKGKKDAPTNYAGTVGTTGFSNASGPMTPGVREHRAITYDGFQVNYYQNGVWQGKRKVQPRDKMLWKMRQLTVGCNMKRTAFFAGTIDQMRVSKVARYTNWTEPVVTRFTKDDATLALYDFNEGRGDVLTDTSGNGNDGKIFGATWGSPAIGLQFDGVDDSVQMNSLGWSSKQYTVEVYVTSQSNRGPVIQLGGENGLLQLYVFKGGSGVGMSYDKPYISVDGPREGSVRQHLAAVFDGQHLSYFVDGKLAGTKTNVSETTAAWGFDRMIIGSRLNKNATENSGNFKGRIDQLRVSSTVRYMLNFKPNPQLAADDSTLALYRFDQNLGETVKDISGNGHAGQISGATWVNAATPK